MAQHLNPTLIMPNSIIADNWSLQNIGEMLTKGLDNENVHCIAVDRENDTHEYQFNKQSSLKYRGSIRPTLVRSMEYE